MDEQKTVDINDFKKEQAKRKLNDWLDKYIIRPAKALVNWAVENPALAIGAATAMIPLANKVIRFKQYQAEDRRRATDYYDPRNGRHVYVRRPLNRSEQIEVDRRYDAGESYTKIFDDMRLLK